MSKWRVGEPMDGKICDAPDYPGDEDCETCLRDNCETCNCEVIHLDFGVAREAIALRRKQHGGLPGLAKCGIISCRALEKKR